jgi:hypothetical protein
MPMLGKIFDRPIDMDSAYRMSRYFFGNKIFIILLESAEKSELRPLQKNGREVPLRYYEERNI